jgi:hypothetical protein
MGQKTLSMTLRYAPLSTEHRLAAVRGSNQRPAAEKALLMPD